MPDSELIKAARAVVVSWPPLTQEQIRDLTRMALRHRRDVARRERVARSREQ